MDESVEGRDVEMGDGEDEQPEPSTQEEAPDFSFHFESLLNVEKSPQERSLLRAMIEDEEEEAMLRLRAYDVSKLTGIQDDRGNHIMHLAILFNMPRVLKYLIGITCPLID